MPLTLSGHLGKAVLTEFLKTSRFSRLTTEQSSHKINRMLLMDFNGSRVNCSEVETWRALSTSWLCSTRALHVFNFWACEKPLWSWCPHSMSWLSKVKILDLLVTPLALCTWKHHLLHHLCWEECHKHLNLTINASCITQACLSKADNFWGKTDLHKHDYASGWGRSWTKPSTDLPLTEAE